MINNLCRETLAGLNTNLKEKKKIFMCAALAMDYNVIKNI